ncbi:phage tail protein [Myxococcus sp. K15C18031901]|uniref:phage tail protein n=1 Tax=Myxococcus dinghuensis TaxID=2906761 RepID=UPI0020A7D82C|nr:phage tail protein [Myxococcus dinghuensis]MCP3100754.1 phage tail protein [Myxococcus dinghuensis]
MTTAFAPLFTFRFEVSIQEQPLHGGGGDLSPDPAGAFSECTGLEATMEPKVIKAGGNNYGAIQRVGPVTFATVVLKRGISRDGRLFKWFERVATGDTGHRCTVRIHLKTVPESTAAEPPVLLTWRLERALPIKFKAADFNARATEVGIEELHLAHEGLFLESQGTTGA